MPIYKHGPTHHASCGLNTICVMVIDTIVIIQENTRVMGHSFNTPSLSRVKPKVIIGTDTLQLMNQNSVRVMDQNT